MENKHVLIVLQYNLIYVLTSMVLLPKVFYKNSKRSNYHWERNIEVNKNKRGQEPCSL